MKTVKVAPFQVWHGKYAGDFFVEVVSVDKKTNTVKAMGIQSREVLDYKLDTWYDYYEFRVRPLCDIAREIDKYWNPVWFGAVPYVREMRHCFNITDGFGMNVESAADYVRYFLSNAQTWKGPEAKRIKAELKALLETV